MQKDTINKDTIKNIENLKTVINKTEMNKEDLLLLVEEIKLTQLTLQQEIAKIKKALVYLKKLIDENHKL